MTAFFALTAKGCGCHNTSAANASTIGGATCVEPTHVALYALIIKAAIPANWGERVPLLKRVTNPAIPFEAPG